MSHRRLLIAFAVVVAVLPSQVGASAVAPMPTAPVGAATGHLRAGVAKVDSTWHVGAGAGQYATTGTFATDQGVDPTHHSTRRGSSYGIQSREFVRALVVEGPQGNRWALVANDLYIPQDLLNRRVAGLLVEHDRNVDLGLATGPKTGIDGANLTVSVSHSHSSPYYSTPSWGVWAFQDVFDFRFYEHLAQKMADAVIAASTTLVPVRVGGSVSYFNKTQRHSYGPTLADDGTPAGFPQTDLLEDRTVASTKNENTVTVVRFDDISQPAAPEPLANWVVFGMHPEMLDGNDLLSGEYVNTMARIVDREVGGMTIFSQQNTGTAEDQRDAQAQPPSARAEFAHREYAQMERAARLLATVVEKTRDDIANNTPEDPEQFAPFAVDATLGVTDMRFAPPSARVAPVVSSCRTEKAFNGNPGVPIAGLPDCVFPAESVAPAVVSALPPELRPSVTYEQLRAAGVPIPDNVGAPSYTGLEETLQVHLQAVRIGSIGITICPCEQWGDQSHNIRSRLNKTDGDFWDGFDWANVTRDGTTPFCSQNGDTTWTCADPRVWHWEGARQVWDRNLAPISDTAYRHMRAQIHNDARGWEELSYTPYAETEEPDISKIKGNYTHEELTAHAYDLVVPVGMSNDYFGYIATYREFQRGDHYRKALTGLGPHSSDFLATRLTRMAASLNGGAPVEYSPKDLAYGPEDLHEYQRAQALGEAARAVVPLYEATLPTDGGVARAVAQPSDVECFSAASFAWIGGDNYTDTPHARVQRLVDGEWTPFADGTGEVQVKVDYPKPADLPAWRAGTFEWRWHATFETFVSDIALPDATGVVRRATPAGTYRFVVDGARREGAPASEVSYRVTSEPFTVKPWSGITVRDLRQDPDGRASFVLGPTHCYTYGAAGLNCDAGAGPVSGYTLGAVDYPDTYASPFRFIRGRNFPDNLKTYFAGRADDEQFCLECSFRPWLDTWTPSSVSITVWSPDGGERTESATYDIATGRYRGPVLSTGEKAWIASSTITDEFGNTNGEDTPPIAAA
jgi:hypothetical protein